MKIFLDGIPVQYPMLSLKKPKFSLRKKTDTGESAFSFTGDMQFNGADYNYLYLHLVTDPNAINNRVKLKFVDDCCNNAREFEFWILPESLKWCEGSCILTAAAVEATIAQEQLNCLKSTMVYDDWNGFQSQQHPRMSYCNELRPNWLHDMLIILTIATWTSILVLGPMLLVVASIIQTINFIIGIVNGIIGALNSLLPSGSEINTVDPIDLDGDASTNPYEEMYNWVNQLLQISFGCGRKHPSPLVRNYMYNVCGKCGLTFQSSIFTDPNSSRFNTVYHNAPVNKGIDPLDTTTYWIHGNKPNLNGVTFLNNLKPVFAGDWRIHNSVLTFEREDYFVPSTPWLDLTTFPSERFVKRVCWNWTRKERYAYLNAYYMKDGINEVGNEAIDRWGDIVEWNQPYSPLQRDEYKPLINFSACRFRDDGIDRDVLTTYEDLPTISGLIGPYKNSIILNSHTCFNPMLLIWDGTDVANGKVSGANAYFSGGPAGLNEYYNYPYWIKAGYPGNLYDEFLFIKNPRYSGWKAKDFTVQIRFGCKEINDMDLDGTIMTSEGIAKVDSIDVDYTTQIMTINGNI